MPVDNKEKQDILNSISMSGAASKENIQTNHIILGSRQNLNHIANNSSGLLKIYPSIAKKFDLILNQPSILSPLSPFEIRCVLCKRVISYPCWYYNKKYAINHFHYFICFDREDVNQPTCRCYRKDV